MASNSETPRDRLTAAAKPKNRTTKTLSTYEDHAHFISTLASQSASAYRRIQAHACCPARRVGRTEKISPPTHVPPGRTRTHRASFYEWLAVMYNIYNVVDWSTICQEVWEGLRPAFAHLCLFEGARYCQSRVFDFI